MAVFRHESLHTLSEKEYILGRKEKAAGGCLSIGRYYALDGSLGAPVYLDALHPHVVFICGKRGYGKSFTIGVFLEEIAGLEESVRRHLGVVVVDTLGIYWTTQFPSSQQSSEWRCWGRKPKGIAIRLFVPSFATRLYEKNGIAVQRFTLRTSDLTPLHWCRLFTIKQTDPVGVLITRAVDTLLTTMPAFSVDDLLGFLSRDERAEPSVKAAAENFFFMVKSWRVFEAEGLLMTDLVVPGMLTILDLSYFNSPVLKDILVSLIAEKLFEARVRQRKVDEQKKMGLSIQETGIPQVWLAIDEAQLFLPSGHETLSKEVLINEWMRQGRQPGLSLLLATQRPSAVEAEVLSHSDVFICHRLTTQEDIDALSHIRPTYMHGDIKESIKKIGIEKGVALLIDDTSESVHLVQIRPRMSWHGGAEPVILEDCKKT